MEINTTIELRRTDSSNSDFNNLVVLLDQDLAISDGADHDFYQQYNKLDSIKYVVLAYDSGKAIGCGAMKEYDSSAMEIKRMFTLPENRGKGVASKLLNELECWAKEFSFKKCILETGTKQPHAIALYKKNGYAIIENYGQYEGVSNSVCFEKSVI